MYISLGKSVSIFHLLSMIKANHQQHKMWGSLPPFPGKCVCLPCPSTRSQARLSRHHLCFLKECSLTLPNICKLLVR